MDADTLWHPEEKLTNGPFFIFGLCLDSLFRRVAHVVRQIWAFGTLNSCVSTAELASFSLFGWNLGPAAVCMLSSKVCFNLVSFLCHLLRSGHFLLYFLLPTSTWETFIYTMLFWWFAEIKNVTLQFFQSAHLSAFPLGSEGHMHF